MNGLLSVNADLHTHAIGDGRFDDSAGDFVARHVEAALEAGLHCLGVTDHDNLQPGLLAQEYVASRNLPLLVLPGMEVTTTEGHLVALGLSEPVAPWRSMSETINEVRARGGLCILPHPFFEHLRLRDDIDAIERLNYRYGDFDITRDDIAVIASSDAHAPADLNASPHHTLLHVRDLTWDGVAEAVRERRACIVLRGDVNHGGRAWEDIERDDEHL